MSPCAAAGEGDAAARRDLKPRPAEKNLIPDGVMKLCIIVNIPLPWYVHPVCQV